MCKLSSLPNIGKELEKKLNETGITNVQMLKDMGSCQAFELIKDSNPGACINTLYALEGAVQEIRWHQLGTTKKDELRQYYNMLKLGD